MKIYYNDIFQKKLSLMHFLLDNKKSSKKSFYSKSLKSTSQKDDVIISAESKRLCIPSKSNGDNTNLNIDKRIDLQSFIDAINIENNEKLKSVGSEIDYGEVKLKTYVDAVHDAINYKYSQLVKIAKTQPDPANYIEEKYFCPTSPHFQSGLSEAERSTGYQHEMDMFKYGKIGHIHFDDSLLRGFNFEDDQLDECMLERKIVNAQVKNIFEAANINMVPITDTCIFTVDPYSYHISVSGVSDDVRIEMETALNKGENGKNLFFHINHATLQDGSNSKQVSQEARLKHRAFSEVKYYTDLDLNNLTQKNGTFYTQDGIDIQDIVSEGIKNKISSQYVPQVTDCIRQYIREIAQKSWKKTDDMYLSIRYTSTGLIDVDQDLIFG